MAKYRKVDPRIWNDAKFRLLSDHGKLVFFFLLTHPNMTPLGAMRGTIPGLAAEIGWTDKAFREAFREAFKEGMILHDEKAFFFWLPNFMKYNRPESPNVVKAWLGSVDSLPECNLLYRAITAACECAEGLGKAFTEALPKDFAKGMPYQEQEQEQEQEQYIKDFCSELSETDTSEPPLMEFPLSKNGDKFPVFKKDVDQWQDTFPGVDVQQALKECRQWNIDNPQKRKTRAGIKSHISRWLGKIQNSGRQAAAVGQQKTSIKGLTF